MDAYQITFIVAFALGMAELVTGAFLFLGLAIGALAVALLQWLAGGYNLNRDLLLFAVVSTTAFVLLRKFFARKADQHEAKEDVNRY